MKQKIRPYYRGFYKVYTEDYEAMKKIASWKDCRMSGIYYNKNLQITGWDLIFPSKLYNKVAKAASLPLKAKNPNRQKQGQIMADKNCHHQFKG